MNVNDLANKFNELQKNDCGELPVYHSFNEILSVEVVNDVEGKPAFVKIKGHEPE